MIKKVITATVSRTVQSVCKTMYENNIGCLVIVKRMMSGLVPVGIITERDIMKNNRFYRPIYRSGSNKRFYVLAIGYIFKVKAGELTRWYVINAGPRGNVAFNFAGGLINENSINDSRFNISKNYKDISQSKIYEISIPPGSGNVIEAIFPEEGTYFGNDHDLARVLGGAGFVILATRNSTAEDHMNGS